MMTLSKLWLFLLSAACGLLLIAMLVSPVQLRMAMARSGEERMSLARQSAVLLLANSARKWVDSAIAVASDGVLQSTLDEMPRGQAEMEVLHKTAKEELRKITSALGISLAIVTDARGKVLARVGVDEEVYQDSIFGYPLVQDATRGYQMDDFWILGDRLYRLAAAPVIGPNRDRYVGAVILGQEVTKELAQQMRTVLDMDVAFLGGGQILSTSGAEPPTSVRESAADLLARGMRGDVVRSLGATEQPSSDKASDEWQVVLLPLPGEAAQSGAALALFAQKTSTVSSRALVLGMIDALATVRLRPEQVLLLLSGMVLLFLLGVFFVRIEAEGPMERLLLELKEVTKATPQGSEPKKEKIDEQRYKRSFHQVALLVNALLRLRKEESASALSPEPQPTKPPREEPGQEHPQAPIFSQLPTAPAVPTALLASKTEVRKAASGLSSPGRLDPSGVHGAEIAEHPTLTERPPDFNPADVYASSRTIPMQPGRRYGGTAFEELETEASSARTLLEPLDESVLAASSKASPIPGAPTVQDIPPSVVQAAIEQALGTAPAAYSGTGRNLPKGGSRTTAPMPPQPASSVLDPPRNPTLPGTGISVAELRRRASEPTAELRADAAALLSQQTPPFAPEEDLETSFRKTYQEFIQTKMRCSESVEGLTYERFVVKLKQSREQIITQHKCRTVRFHVYVKDGKAALKATPEK